MEWLTTIFETIKNYPLEGLLATVTTVFTGVGTTAGIKALSGWLFSNKKLINKITMPVQNNFNELSGKLNTELNNVKKVINDFENDIKDIKRLIATFNNDEIVAYINTIKSESKEIGLKYEQELLKLKTKSIEIVEEVIETVEKTTEEVAEIVEKETNKIKIRRKKAKDEKDI